MSFSVATVKFSSEKTCFASLSSGLTYETRDVLVYEIERFKDDQKVYVSWSGDTVKAGGNDEQILQLNGIFADKLGLKEDKQVILREVKTVKHCLKVHVEPVTADDWEIFNRHAASIESRLMNQIRVIQTGMVYPIWVEKSNCVFVKIGAMTPDSDCCLLVNETEVTVEPKVRSSQIGLPVIEEPIEKSVTVNQEVPYLRTASHAFSEEDQFEPKFDSGDSDLFRKEKPLDFLDGQSNDRKRERSPYDFINSGISGHWRSLVSSLLGFHQGNQTKVALSDNDDDYDDDSDLDEAYHCEQKDGTISSGLSFVLRIQPLEFNTRDSDYDSKQPEYRRGSQSPRKNGGSSPRKSSRESPSKSNRTMSNPSLSNFRLNYVPKQPSNVYVDKSDLEKLFKANRQDIPSTFIAKIRKLRSPKEEYLAAGVKSSLKKDMKSEKDKIDIKTEKDKISPSSTRSFDSSESPNSPEIPGKESESFCVVRVIVIDRRRQLCNDMYFDIVKRVLEEQPLLRGHVIIPDTIRRTLKLDKTSRVWIQTYTGLPALTDAFTLYPLGNPSKKVADETLKQAFRRWLDYVSCEEYPLIIYQGIFLRFEYQPNSYVEVQLTYNEKSLLMKSCYGLLHPGALKGAALGVVSGIRTTELTHPAVRPMLAYTSIENIDPIVPKITIDTLGGMSDLVQLALSNIEICLGSRPLYKEMFLSTPGLLNGMLLLTGQKGSGKTTLVKALCNELSKLPNLAYTNIVDCKPLRGKKVDTIQKMFELQFDEAAWRQPSLLVFDNLDHIAGSPAGPEFEMTAEALYATRVAEVLKDLLRKDIRNMTHVAVLATSQSRSSLHTILVSSRGAHLVQEVMTISPPDKAQREDILRKIMIENTTISESSVNEIDLGSLSHKMQGYVARDLENVINRAIHAHILTQGRAMHKDLEIDINEEDFEKAMWGFTPASIRNVALHQAGELGWEDVGGLTEVKETLIETLQWPSKYPVLFSNCPLRLRSGLLLYGAPGTGKTLLAGVVAKECGLNFISIKGPELLSKYIGASEQAVRDTFVRAQSAKPCILFFDEFDSIAPRRGHDNTGVTDRVVNQLLTQLDGVEGLDGVYVLAATSRPDLIDPALLRPGRLDKCLQCQMPNQEERLKILNALSRKMNLGDVDSKYFAETCEDFTGADFKALLYNAQLEAIHEFMAQSVSDRSSHQFGIKRSAAARFKNRVKKGLTSDTVGERRKSCSGTYAYIPNLEEGIVNINADIEEKLSTQEDSDHDTYTAVSQIRLRERRSSEHIPGDDKPDSPYLPTKLITVHHKHMLSAVSKMRPSVTGDEKLKYQRIYEKFQGAREGTFNMGYMEAAEMMKQMKATLA